MSIKVGDVVAWAAVPDGALVREHDGGCAGAVTLRRGTQGRVLRLSADSDQWGVLADGWSWGAASTRNVVILALVVSADATVEHLRSLTECFEVREALSDWNPLAFLVLTGGIGPDAQSIDIDEAAQRLAGKWKPENGRVAAVRVLWGDGSPLIDDMRHCDSTEVQS